MSDSEMKLFNQQLKQGLDLASYRMMRDKAMRNLSVIIGDDKGGWRKVSARDEFVRLYHEPVPTF